MPKFNGKICSKHPEIAGERYVTKNGVVGGCVQCAKDMGAARYAANRESIKRRTRDYSVKNPEKNKIWQKTYRGKNQEECNRRVAVSRAKNPGASAAYSKAYRAANPEVGKLYAKKYNLSNRGKKNAAWGAYRAAKLQATPSWADKFFIDEIYDLAQLRTKATGFKWVVDHIVPLRSDKVCGLHWEGNLAVIPEKDNILKGNRFWPDMT